ncbi:TrkA-C domain-containing protein [Salinarchaeum sp. Harcht-Bsk1]|uniref:potassium channel family protein n=1 Tax=Salinarchaeum sp. Harcht-Bsk1 TaxID=1333523 RepID=UPI0003422E21|nr:NAD-binding protein [Salinarchaeum sp. Harcht-Bsk1]AGN01487.1 TrkA-C domain-containing protein [Salinarchaeum sp. Harcht-Bsk1]
MRSLTEFGDLTPRNLTKRQRLVGLLAIAIGSVVLFYTVFYYLGMRTLEDRPRSIFHSLQIVVETMTTTGYGADSPWDSPWMNLYMVAMQFSGVLIGLATLRVLVIPLFEQTPLNLDDRLTPKRDHVVVAEYKRDTGVLLDELETLDVDYVLIESDEEEAKRLSDDGYQAINGDPEDAKDLERATIRKASLLITDAGDATASVVLTALEMNEDLRVVSFTESARRTAALAEVGVDRSVAPHALIGRRLAEKATTPVSIDGGPGGERLSEDVGGERDAGGEAPSATSGVGVREILVRRDSPLHGVLVGESPLAAHPSLTLVAGWFDGHLQVPPAPDARLTPNAVLVVAGPEDEIDALVGEVGGVSSPQAARHERIVVAGLGEGGRSAVEVLPATANATTIDEDESREPDVVGDVTEPGTLEAAGIDDASALVVTVDDDASALLTIAMARSLAPDVEILARVTDAAKTAPAFRAGADYVLSVQRVCARLVANEVYGERVVDFASQLRIVRVESAAFVGETLGELRERRDRGWTVVGVVRSDGVRTDAGIEVVESDEVLVAGSDEAIQEFERAVG